MPAYDKVGFLPPDRGEVSADVCLFEIQLTLYLVMYMPSLKGHLILTSLFNTLQLLRVHLGLFLEFPGVFVGALASGGVSLALTRRSQRFFGRLKPLL